MLTWKVGVVIFHGGSQDSAKKPDETEVNLRVALKDGGAWTRDGYMALRYSLWEQHAVQ